MAYLGNIGISRSGGRYLKVASSSATTRRASYCAAIVTHTKTIGKRPSLRAKTVTHTKTQKPSFRYYKRIPWWTSDARVLCTIPTIGSLVGVVKREGVIIEKAPVTLYYRKNGAKIETILSDASGGFLFVGLDPGDYYTIVAGDTQYPPTAYNAQVYDFLSPVAP